MEFITAVKTCFAKYATFEGRAQRSEFWYFTLFNWVFQLPLMVIDATLGTPLGIIGFLITLLPSIGVAVRRLHDIDRSGWWYLVLLIPLVGIVLFIIWACTKGTDGPNRFGGNPLGGQGEPVALPA